MRCTPSCCVHCLLLFFFLVSSGHSFWFFNGIISPTSPADRGLREQEINISYASCICKGNNTRSRPKWAPITIEIIWWQWQYITCCDFLVFDRIGNIVLAVHRLRRFDLTWHKFDLNGRTGEPRALGGENGAYLAKRCGFCPRNRVKLPELPLCEMQVLRVLDAWATGAWVIRVGFFCVFFFVVCWHRR